MKIHKISDTYSQILLVCGPLGCQWQGGSTNRKTNGQSLLLYTLREISNFIYSEKDTKFEKFFHFKLVHVARDFHPWDVMTKVLYFLMVQIDNFMNL